MSTIIKVKCIDQSLTLVGTPLVASGGKNEDVAQFEFCEKWDGYAKTATFYQDEKHVYYSLIDEKDTCVIPWEVLQKEGYIYFGVFGSKDNVTRTSQILKYKVVKGAITENIEPSDPTPDIYQQMLVEAKRIRDYFIQLKDEKLCKHSFLTDIEVEECCDGTYVEEWEDKNCGEFVIYDGGTSESITQKELIEILV